jgi:flotillin
MLVEKMPEIIAAAASQLSNANVTVLNGADGMGQLLVGLAGQAGQLMRLVQEGLSGPPLGEILEGESEADPSQNGGS